MEASSAMQPEQGTAAISPQAAGPMAPPKPVPVFQHPNAGKTSAKPVECLDLEGNVLDVFSSGSFAAKRLGIPQGEISACCRGTKQTAGGYRFRFQRSPRNLQDLPGVPTCVRTELVPKSSLSGKTQAKPVECMDLEGNVLEVYGSGSFAAKNLNILQGDISACCRGQKYSAGGYRFRFQNDEIKDRYAELHKGAPKKIFLPGEEGATSADGTGRKREGTNAKPIECLDLEGNVIEIFQSGRIASQKLNIVQGDISLCCRGMKYSVNGYRFRFYGDEIEDRFAERQKGGLKKGFVLEQMSSEQQQAEGLAMTRSTRASRGEYSSRANNELDPSKVLIPATLKVGDFTAKNIF